MMFISSEQTRIVIARQLDRLGEHGKDKSVGIVT